MHRFTFKLPLLVLFAICFLMQTALVQAEDESDPNKEIVYRASLGRSNDVQMLIKQNADVNAKNEKGVPLVALAAMRKDQEAFRVLDTLIGSGANINAQDANGETALFYAARDGYKEMVTYLLEHGVDYYLPNNKGDIARTIAFNAGHNGLVETMDKFVTDLSKKRAAEYRNYNKELEDRNRQIEEQILQQRLAQEEAAMKAADEAAAKAENVKTEAKVKPSSQKSETETSPVKQIPAEVLPPKAEPPQPTGPSPEELEAAKQKEFEAKRETQAFKDDMFQLAFHSCAFQYLSFCSQTGQRTDVTFEQLSDGIEAQRENTLTLMKKIPKEYGLEKSYADQISHGAKQRVQNDMNQMPSKQYIFEHGVCKMDDVRVRCKAIGNSWRDLASEIEEEAPPVNETGSQSTSPRKNNLLKKQPSQKKTATQKKYGSKNHHKKY